MGSTMETTRVLYEPIEDVEIMEYYQAGGYHPVTIGDRFRNRYRIVHKLGHGTYSTIWLARDEISNKYVAVKVCTADSNPSENNVLRKLSETHQLSDIDKSMIPSIWDRFNIEGPNGNHVCLVTSPARMSISDAKNASWVSLFQVEVARAIAAQLVMAIQYIHSAGYVHGDLHRGNILLQLSRQFDQLSAEMLYEQYGEPVLEPVNRLDGQKLPPGVPDYGVLPVWLGEASENVTLPEAKIRVSDFGEAFSPVKEKRFESRTPLLVSPPEARFEPNEPLTFPSDIWTLACTIWDIIAQRSLFEGFLTNEDDMTRQQIGSLGPLPAEWWRKWEAGRVEFTKRGEPIDRLKSVNQSWEDRFETSVQRPRIEEGMLPLEPSERDALLSMLRSMLSFRPEDRPSAQQVLGSKWMVKWALPEFEKIHMTL
ncbi:protein kinase domain protein [Aspergillus nomiae NRRL 13137]|uniref:non-specific serine/threonine protein kinase n=1 Tax=Aspergillus nomiae NRRL (strain ATCC 15546 / NRRL 13137 / CBS 260.88 / M93) TaxID=1509407 RepID=A0A0L1IKH3_ASPN3|nr:protein kinase domain protein [Aspergillus nomiae NRRL 13137]KNG79992.1 protein kinase domain protein [Aspergillus nomiae NRRL 13137]